MEQSNNNQRTPNNIFEQILFGTNIVNDNVVDLSKDFTQFVQSMITYNETVSQKLDHAIAAIDEMRQALFMPPVPTDNEPNAPGAETEEQ